MTERNLHEGKIITLWQEGNCIKVRVVTSRYLCEGTEGVIVTRRCLYEGRNDISLTGRCL